MLPCLQYIVVYADCPAGYIFNPHTTTCYGMVSQRSTWEDAKLHCEMRGEYLAVFETRKSANWLGTLLPGWKSLSVDLK